METATFRQFVENGIQAQKKVDEIINENQYDYHLIILGEPKAQQRHRSAIIPRKGCHGIEIGLIGSREVVRFYRKEDLFIHNYDPSEKEKKDIRRLVRAEAPEKPLLGPMRVDLYYYFGHLKGHYGTGRNSGVLKPNAPKLKDTGKDKDNCDKLYLDALTGLFFVNDSQVCKGESQKLYSEKPRTEIFITKL